MINIILEGIIRIEMIEEEAAQGHIIEKEDETI